MGERLRGQAPTTAPSLPCQGAGAVRLRERWRGHPTGPRSCCLGYNSPGAAQARMKGKRPGQGAKAAKTPHCYSRGIRSVCPRPWAARRGGPCGAGAPPLLVLLAVCQGDRALRLAVAFRAGSASRKRRAASLRGSAGGRVRQRLLVRAAVYHQRSAQPLVATVRGRGLSPRRGCSRRNPGGARRWVRRPSCARSRHPPGAVSGEGARVRAREGALRPGEEPGMALGKALPRAGVAVRCGRRGGRARSAQSGGSAEAGGRRGRGAGGCSPAGGRGPAGPARPFPFPNIARAGRRGAQGCSSIMFSFS